MTDPTPIQPRLEEGQSGHPAESAGDLHKRHEQGPCSYCPPPEVRRHLIAIGAGIDEYTVYTWLRGEETWQTPARAALVEVHDAIETAVGELRADELFTTVWAFLEAVEDGRSQLVRVRFDEVNLELAGLDLDPELGERFRTALEALEDERAALGRRRWATAVASASASAADDDEADRLRRMLRIIHATVNAAADGEPFLAAPVTR